MRRDLLSCYPTGLLEFHPTDVCDLDCVECHYRAKGDDTFPFKEVASGVQRLPPRAITIRGGGEPNLYFSGGQDFFQLLLSIKGALPGVHLGLINNNTYLPPGAWPKLLAWQRSSIDAATPDTYVALKRRPLFETAVKNVQRFLCETAIPHVGVGFLFRRESAHELFLFLNNWFDWISGEAASLQRRFNIQFRSISPGIEELAELRASGKPYPDRATLETLSEHTARVRRRMYVDPPFAAFIAQHTNFESSFASCDSSLFLHSPKSFEHCYNALCLRVLRATGEEYPDFLLCNDPELSLGNALRAPDENGALRVALMQYFYFNRSGPFCCPEECRQGWVSNTIERLRAKGQAVREGAEDPIAYFF